MRKMLFLSGSLLLLLSGCVYLHIHICRAMLEKEEGERQAAAARDKLDNTGEHRERERERAVRSSRLYDGVVLLLLLSVSKRSLLCVCVCLSIDRLQSI